MTPGSTRAALAAAILMLGLSLSACTYQGAPPTPRDKPVVDSLRAAVKVSPQIQTSTWKLWAAPGTGDGDDYRQDVGVELIVKDVSPAAVTEAVQATIDAVASASDRHMLHQGVEVLLIEALVDDPKGATPVDDETMQAVATKLGLDYSRGELMAKRADIEDLRRP